MGWPRRPNAATRSRGIDSDNGSEFINDELYRYCKANEITFSRWACPECGVELATYDHAEMRAWRHLDSCGFKTFLHACPPRVRCPSHGVRQVRLPWAEPHSRFTTLFERLAIEVLLQTDVDGAGRILRISWDEAWAIKQRAVRRGLAAKTHRIPERRRRESRQEGT